MLRRELKYILLAFLCFSATACSWVKTDTSDCPTGVWLQLEYSYNMLDADAASNHINDAFVVLYDTVGQPQYQFAVTKDVLAANAGRIELAGVAEGCYDIVVWSGASASDYAYSPQMSYADFRLRLADNSGQTSKDLTALFYGKTDSVCVSSRYAVHRVPMMKDTNRIICLVESESETNEISPDVYSMELVADNTVLDAGNHIVPSTPTTYLPYSAESDVINDPDLGERHVARFGISTMRLMADDNARLVLRLKDTGFEVFNIPLCQYIAQVASLSEINGRPLGVQEYLDRQDQFTFVFCLSSASNAIIRCKVNNWIVRHKDNINL